MKVQKEYMQYAINQFRKDRTAGVPQVSFR
jgi:hypothetical protein